MQKKHACRENDYPRLLHTYIGCQQIRNSINIPRCRNSNIVEHLTAFSVQETYIAIYIFKKNETGRNNVCYLVQVSTININIPYLLLNTYNEVKNT